MTAAGAEDHGIQFDRLDQAWQLRREVEEIVNKTPVFDIHTHLYPPSFGGLSLNGIDELLTYHYLIAETFRSAKVRPEQFWRMSKTGQADIVWKTLFVENTPLSEAARGVITILSYFGLDTSAKDLSEARAFFRSRNVSEHFSRVLDGACVSDVVMTNDPFNEQEAGVWKKRVDLDPRFHAALRIDPLLNEWEDVAPKLASMGYLVEANLSGGTVLEVRRFLDEWIALMKPVCLAASLPDDFRFPESDLRSRVIREIVLATASEHRIPFALMIGVRRGVNPSLRAAGDGVGKADVRSVERLCGDNPDVRFLVTFLSRENQHELCVAARKFTNLLPFGCWWFLNNPSIVQEITSERIELLGASFIPQHSDARILEQLIYKWKHSRQVIASVLSQSYELLLKSGRAVTREEIARDVTRMFSGNFREVAGLH